jgi:ribosomal protein L44E
VNRMMCPSRMSHTAIAVAYAALRAAKVIAQVRRRRTRPASAYRTSDTINGESEFA